MKANYRTYSRTELAKIANETARKELEERKDEMYKNVEKDCTNQALAVTFWALHKEFGFGKKRLARLRREVESLYLLMINSNGEIMGNEFSPRNLQAGLKEKFGIDFDKSDFESEEKEK